MDSDIVPEQVVTATLQSLVEQADRLRPSAKRPRRSDDTSSLGSNSDGDFEIHETEKKKRKIIDSKKKHNVTSQMGRQKINQEIESIRELLPECKSSDYNKARVLHCAVSKIQQYQTELRQLNEKLASLQKEYVTLQKANTSMWEQVEKSKAGHPAAAYATPIGYPMFMSSGPSYPHMFNMPAVAMQHVPLQIPFQTTPQPMPSMQASSSNAPSSPPAQSPGEKHIMQAMSQPVPIHTSSM